MTSKSAGIWLILIAIFLAVIVLTSEDGDRELAQQLDQNVKRNAPSVFVEQQIETEKPDPQSQAEVWRLTDQLQCTKFPGRADWYVNHPNGPSVIRLPFVPASSGGYPIAATADQQHGQPTSSESRQAASSGYVGAAACAECHQPRYDEFVRTAHHLTSAELAPATLRGSHTPPGNTLTGPDPNLVFAVQQRDDRFFQSVSYYDWQIDVPMDIVTGSAKTGQTFLYWRGDALFQAHLSYMTSEDEWIPSPGFMDTMVNYARPMLAGCLECHITYIERKAEPNLYHRDSAILGISCERCHGAGREHIEFHQAHPSEKTARYIVEPSDLDRDSQLDICAQCHSGTFDLLGEPFSHRPGDDLDAHHRLHRHEFAGSSSGIHTTNQLARLRKSQCFQQTEMTCTTCHDPHQFQRGDSAIFTAACLGCHQPESCGLSGQLGAKIADNCVSCHMPLSDNHDILMQSSQGDFVMPMVDHYIRVDRSSSDQYLRTDRDQD